MITYIIFFAFVVGGISMNIFRFLMYDRMARLGYLKKYYASEIAHETFMNLMQNADDIKLQRYRRLYQLSLMLLGGAFFLFIIVAIFKLSSSG